MNSKEIYPGDEIKDKYGFWHVVAIVYDNAVYVCDGNSPVHSSNIIAVIHPEK